MAASETVRIREARPTDAAGIARVHVDAWRDAYAALLPADHLAGLDLPRRRIHWARVLAQPRAAQTTLVAEADGEIVGFCGFGPDRSGPAAGEVYGLYIASDWREQGIGRDLIEQAFAALRRRGVGSVVIWCLEGNFAARGFYGRCGGRLLQESRVEDIAGMPLPTVGFHWDL